MDDRRGPWIRHLPAAALLATLVACKGNGATGTTARAIGDTNDRLLALAPSGVRTAIVASPRAIELLEAARARVRAMGRADETIRATLARAEESVADILGVPAGSELGQLGLGPTRGFALFEVEHDQTLTIWPVVDRAAFVAAFHGQAGADGVDTVEIAHQPQRCRAVQGVYACATDVALLDRLGTEPVSGRPARAGARGDLELVASTSGDLATDQTVAAIVALEPGKLLMRARFARELGGPFAALAEEQVTIEPGRASGFAAVGVPLSFLKGTRGPLGAAGAVLRGQLTAVVPSGVSDVDLRVPLANAAAGRGLLALCDQLSLGPTLSAVVDHGACVVSAAGPPAFSVTAWIDGDTLRLGKTRGDVAAATGPEPTEAGRELASVPWNLVAWGRGTMLASPTATDWGRVAPDPTAAAALRSLAYLTELGVGMRYDEDGVAVTLIVRTALANPPEIADAIAPLVARAARGESVKAELEALAAAHPSSPLAGDVAAGHVGLLVPLAGAGILAGVMVPRFGAGDRATEHGEADVNLHAIALSLDDVYAEDGHFPVATAPLTPAQPCCAGPHHRCAASAADWRGVDAWDSLGFEMTEPFDFQYSYTSDGKTVAVEAVGDLDCDGVPITYTLRGTVDRGRPRWTLIRPTRAD